MPELPEVETIRLDLDQEIVGRSIDNVSITGVRTVRRHDADRIAKTITGRPVTGTRRIGKYLLIDLGVVTWALHLRMSGQLLWTTNANLPLVKHTHARIAFSGAELRFVDPRTFGEMWVTSNDVPELAHLGRDALTDPPDWRWLSTAFARRSRPSKLVLLDQSIVAGIGNIYADEILWAARIRSTKPVNQLGAPACKRLAEAIPAVLAEAVAARGSTLRDQQYVDLYGMVGDAQRTHNVHDREGLPCPRDGAAIRRVVIGGRSAYYCPRCQR